MTSHDRAAPLSRRSVWIAIPLTAALIAWFTAWFVARYWYYWRLGGAGSNGMALAGVVLPGVFAGAWAMGGAIAWSMRRRAVSRIATFGAAVAGMSVLAMSWVGVEVRRTAAIETEMCEAPHLGPVLARLGASDPGQCWGLASP